MGRSLSGDERDGGRREVSASAARDEVADEVAHVRARFGIDPGTPPRLADAWTAPTGTLEEDESEFLDAVADCLSVGLPLDAAVASWRSGTLEVAAEADQGDQGEDDNEDTSVFEEDDTRVYVPASAHDAPAR
jgi:hypothetical protein